MEASRLQAHFNSLVGILSALGTAAVLVLGVFRVAAGAISPGDLVVFVSYARKADSPLRHIAAESVRIARSMARAERIAEILAADDVLEERPGAYSGGRAAGELVFEGVSFAYDSSRPALTDVSLRVAAGTRLAVVGASGAGKSTLGALVARLYDPTEGRVLIDGRDLRDCSGAWLREQVGVLLQDTVLFTGTVADNIAYGTDVSSEALVGAARSAAADEFVSALPQAYATELGPQGVGLSGGQRQRIGIARTLLRDPPILLLDEPTSALDADVEALLFEGLEQLMAGRTTILVTHSLDLARRADRVVVLDGGRVVAEGPPARVLSRSLPEDGRARRAQTPADPTLPQLGRLLDASAMLPVLLRSLGRDATIDELAVARVTYRPGVRVSVHYSALVDGREENAVVRAGKNGSVVPPGAFDQVNGRSPAATPVVHDEAVGAVVSWLPCDAALPALVEEPSSLVERLGRTGVELRGSLDAPRLLGYKPDARVVLRLGDHVLKGYGKASQFEQAALGLASSSALGSIPTAPFEASIPELRLTVQAAVDGAAPATAVNAAFEAGSLLRRLEESAVRPLPEAGPSELLAAATRRAALVAAVVPELRGRVDDLVGRLRDSTPNAGRLVPTHGDFHVDQLLQDRDQLVVIDFDGMCLAPPALDLATYLADVVRGRATDREAIDSVREPLLAGYGEWPAALDWYLAAVVLTRAPHPFHRQLPEWPARTEAMVGVAETVLVGAAG